METKAVTSSLAALAALAHEHRLAVFRLLVREGRGGLPAGEVAFKTGLPPSTLSHHLAQLERAGLLYSRRAQRHIYYAVDAAGVRRLVTFLTEDCCQGHPELCGLPPPAPCRGPVDGGAGHDLAETSMIDERTAS